MQPLSVYLRPSTVSPSISVITLQSNSLCAIFLAFSFAYITWLSDNSGSKQIYKIDKTDVDVYELKLVFKISSGTLFLNNTRSMIPQTCIYQKMHVVQIIELTILNNSCQKISKMKTINGEKKKQQW